MAKRARSMRHTNGVEHRMAAEAPEQSERDSYRMAAAVECLWQPKRQANRQQQHDDDDDDSDANVIGERRRTGRANCEKKQQKEFETWEVRKKRLSFLLSFLSSVSRVSPPHEPASGPTSACMPSSAFAHYHNWIGSRGRGA